MVVEVVDAMNGVCVLIFDDGCSTVVMPDVGGPLGKVPPIIGDAKVASVLVTSRVVLLNVVPVSLKKLL